MRRLLPVLIAIAVGVAGCGDDSAKQRNAYADAVNEAQSNFAQSSDYGREIRRAKRAFATGAPQRILDAQTKLVSATTRISSRINRTIAAINRQLQQET